MSEHKIFTILLMSSKGSAKKKWLLKDKDEKKNYIFLLKVRILINKEKLFSNSFTMI